MEILKDEATRASRRGTNELIYRRCEIPSLFAGYIST